eukprot:gene8039-16477_t
MTEVDKSLSLIPFSNPVLLFYSIAIAVHLLRLFLRYFPRLQNGGNADASEVQMSAVSCQSVVSWIEARSNDDEVIEAIRTNPKWIGETPPGSTGSVLESLVVSGNVDLISRILEASRTSTPRGTILFPENLRINSTRTLLDLSREYRAANPAMYDYIRDLSEWDATCEIAKYHMSTQANRLWATLRRHISWCYSSPPTRRWSVSMQVVYYGDVNLLQYMLQICPPPVGLNIWDIRSNDNLTMLDAAQEVAQTYPAMIEFVRARTNTSHGASAPILSEGKDEDVYPSAAAKGDDSEGKDAKEVHETETPQLNEIREQWPAIRAAIVQRGQGVCCILGDEEDNVDLFRTSRDCHHSAGAEGLRGYLETALHSGPFPVRCPICAAGSFTATGAFVQSDRGMVTRGILKGLVEADVISVETGCRLLLQQLRSLPDEPSIDFQYGMSKPCPDCATPIAHYKGHGCHHIKPGSGCPSCHNHFCYSCLSSTGSTWRGCPYNCQLFCTDSCDCPTCLDCTPGHPCDVCEGPNGMCPICRHSAAVNVAVQRTLLKRTCLSQLPACCPTNAYLALSPSLLVSLACFIALVSSSRVLLIRARYLLLMYVCIAAVTASVSRADETLSTMACCCTVTVEMCERLTKLMRQIEK